MADAACSATLTWRESGRPQSVRRRDGFYANSHMFVFGPLVECRFLVGLLIFRTFLSAWTRSMCFSISSFVLVRTASSRAAAAELSLRKNLQKQRTCRILFESAKIEGELEHYAEIDRILFRALFRTLGGRYEGTGKADTLVGLVEPPKSSNRTRNSLLHAKIHFCQKT